MGRRTVRDNVEHLVGLLGAIQERSAPLMASMQADSELARSLAAHVRENADAALELAVLP